MTTKFTITRMANTMMPITKLPLITKLPKAWMTWPAASVPSWPRDRIRRVEARLSDSRSMVAISSTVGKAENSSGVWMNSAVIRISTEKVIEIASAQSSSSGGSGRISTTRMVSTPMASPISPRRRNAEISPRPGSLMALVAVVRLGCGGDVAHACPAQSNGSRLPAAGSGLRAAVGDYPPGNICPVYG